jgi:hypothetical protein
VRTLIFYNFIHLTSCLNNVFVTIKQLTNSIAYYRQVTINLITPDSPSLKLHGTSDVTKNDTQISKHVSLLYFCHNLMPDLWNSNVFLLLTNLFLTFICLRATLSYDLARRAVRSWRQNSFRCFSQRWPWNTLRNLMCGVACCRKEWGGSEIMIINAIRWGAWYYSIVLNACRVTTMADTDIKKKKK